MPLNFSGGNTRVLCVLFLRISVDDCSRFVDIGKGPSTLIPSLLAISKYYMTTTKALYAIIQFINTPKTKYSTFKC